MLIAFLSFSMIKSGSVVLIKFSSGSFLSRNVAKEVARDSKLAVTLLKTFRLSSVRGRTPAQSSPILWANFAIHFLSSQESTAPFPSVEGPILWEHICYIQPPSTLLSSTLSQKGPRPNRSPTWDFRDPTTKLRLASEMVQVAFHSSDVFLCFSLLKSSANSLILFSFPRCSCCSYINLRTLWPETY